MKKTNLKKCITVITCVFCFVLSLAGKDIRLTEKIPADAVKEANAILNDAKISGGIIVHLGCGKGELIAALGMAGDFLVHGLDENAGNIHEAREYITSLNMYGRVSVDRLGDTLPYIDNLVNLVICENDNIPIDEIKRILVPGGKACLINGKKKEFITKPPMENIDDWTHYMHDSTGNAVADDYVVSPPKYLKWTAGPKWAKDHSFMGSIMGFVASNGKTFSILDEGYIGKDQTHAPGSWAVVARDAYNGVVLWRRSISKWQNSFWRLKSGPAQLPERIVADENRVYVTLDINGPVSALDSSTGDTVHVYKESVGTEEILINDGVLFLLRNPLRASGNHKEPIRFDIDGYNRKSPYGETPKEIMAVDADNGKVLWRKKSVVLPTTLSVDNRKVYFHDGEKIVCLSREDGKDQWESSPVARIKPVPAKFTPTLVVYKDVVLFAAGIGDDKKHPDLLSAFDVDTGKKLWETRQPKAYKAAPLGVFGINGLVWTGAVSGGGGGNPYIGRDIHTGEIVKSFERDVDYLHSHSRCYRNKATVKYLLPNIRGIEMADIANETWTVDVWARGGCSHGIVPSHGMIYTTPHACVCFAQSKLTGFNALYGDGMGVKKHPVVKSNARLIKGPAENTSKTVEAKYNDEWPVFRHDNMRSSCIKQDISRDLKTAWISKTGGKLSAVTIAGDILYTADIDNHAVLAVDTASGEKLWSFTTGGRVDSPPTIYESKAYFGSADGYVYCLDASSGRLIWKFLAAASDRRLSSYGQLESVHPVHGSVLVKDDVIYCVAGRSMFLDGGLRLYRINSDTGEQISVNLMNEIDPTTGELLQEKVVHQSLPPSVPDILSSDDDFVYMGIQQFDLNGKRTEINTHSKDRDNVLALQKGAGVHLFSPSGFLDDARFHRNYWLYGKVYFGGHQGEWRAGRAAPSGNILAFNETDVLGYYGSLVRGFMSDSLFSVSKTAEKKKGGGMIELVHNWKTRSPIYVNSVIIAGKTLFVAGSTEHDIESFLYLYSVDNGKQIAQYELPAMPVFDGLAAAKGAVYIALENGAIVCMSGN